MIDAKDYASCKYSCVDITNYGAAQRWTVCCTKRQVTAVITFTVVDGHLKTKPNSDFCSSSGQYENSLCYLNIKISRL